MVPIPTLAALAVLLLAGCADEAPGPNSPARPLPEQAAYDVRFYDLRIQVFPERQAIAGRLTARADVRDTTLRRFVLNLDRRLTVDSVWAKSGQRLRFERRAGGNQLWIRLPEEKAPGAEIRATVAYHGEPRVAPNPPWDGGFTWSETPGGQPWIATSCQTAGPDLWWPAKDFIGDEPDSMRIRATVPQPLVAASNGRLRRVRAHPGDSTRTFDWHVAAPINIYGVALSVAPYDTVRRAYRSASGEEIPAILFALPAHTEAARAAWPEEKRQLRFFEETLGPFPFPNDKIGVAEAPFAGMEHQTLIAHGGAWGQRGGLGYDAPFDAVLLHEMAHEWMGNRVTAAGWGDLWLHEGFATYLEALYAEAVRGDSAYARRIRYFRAQAEGEEPPGPIAWKQPVSAQRAYRRALYFRGALALHALRRRLGDGAFFPLLRRFAAPTRRASTEDFIRAAEAASGRDLGSFFQRWLYEKALPPLEEGPAP